MLLYAATIFVSAFLLFQVQPVIAKIILPWFGGSAGVWTTCLLFFQMVLLGGYLYSHWTIRWLRPRRQALLHIALLAASLLLLPVAPNPSWKPAGDEDPTLRILGLLAATIGLPYFLLSTTGPLLQAWFARDPAMEGRTPYRLYALSNLGSMLALLSYPVLVEPFLATRWQALGWSGAFTLFIVLCGWTALRGRGHAALPENASETSTPRPDAGRMALWAGLAACASTLLLAVTNHLCQNVAAITFLWVLPLSLYLLSFILCFDSDGWYQRRLFLLMLAVALGSMAYALNADSENMPLKLAVPLFSIGMFVCCMVCHGELARLKPDPRHLTSFFLMISLGGALGGVFVGILAPRIFPGYWELPAGLAACALLILMLLHDDPTSPFYQSVWKPEWLIAVALATALTGYLVYGIKGSLSATRVAVRNFYGGLLVSDSGEGEDATRSLTHGTINHGEQYLAPSRRRRPTTYYGPRSGAGVAIAELASRGPEHVGVIGLGTGTLATYGRAGDRYRFYEINPLVIHLANSEFTFLRDCRAKLDVVLGDARLSLEREPVQGFDVLAVDAFSSDSIPVHLLTEEAFRLYFRHLKPGGVLAVHVSNKFLDLKPIVEQAAVALGKPARMVDTDDDEDDSAVFGSTWILLAGDDAFFARPPVKEAIHPLPHRPDLRIWTDDFSNLYRILK
ncbi:MAG: fused MFS/spermidine synthase [Acidobacteria bacterium]|nr:fused MFS/spermidine synthase [Acidobacteriota bacterium]